MLRATTSRDDNRRATDARDEKRELLPAVQRALSEEQIQVVAEKIEAGVAEAEQGRDDESEARRLKARQERERAERQSERQAEAERLEKIRGDALKTQDVKASLIGVDVVMQTLGVGLGDLFRPVDLFSDATRVLIAAMRTQAVKRLICVTGFGAGDSRESISCLQRQSTNPVSEPAFTYREAQTARARVCSPASIRQEGLGLQLLGALGRGRGAQRHQLLIGVAGYCEIARLFGGAGLAENTAEAVGLGAQGQLILLKRLPGLVELQQQVGEQLARRQHRGGRGWMLIHRPVEVRGCPHQFERFLVITLDVGKDAGSPQTLDLNLVRPVRVLCFQQLVF